PMVCDEQRMVTVTPRTPLTTGTASDSLLILRERGNDVGLDASVAQVMDVDTPLRLGLFAVGLDAGTIHVSPLRDDTRNTTVHVTLLCGSRASEWRAWLVRASGITQRLAGSAGSFD